MRNDKSIGLFSALSSNLANFGQFLSIAERSNNQVIESSIINFNVNQVESLLLTNLIDQKAAENKNHNVRLNYIGREDSFIALDIKESNKINTFEFSLYKTEEILFQSMLKANEISNLPYNISLDVKFLNDQRIESIEVTALLVKKPKCKM